MWTNWLDPALLNTVHCMDCLEFMKTLPDNCVDLVLTDPPYPDYYADEYCYFDWILDILKPIKCKQLVFWSSKVDFPLEYTAIHIWDKKCWVWSMYERIFEINWGKNYKVYNYYLINSTVAWSFTWDTFSWHKSQKPIKLIRDLIEEHSKPWDTVLDCFAWSWTTWVACKELWRNYILVEKEPKYVDIINKRLQNTTVSLFHS